MKNKILHNASPSGQLPIKHNLALVYAFSLLIAVLMAAACIAGLASPDSVYPTEDLVQTSVPNDVVTLAIVLPVLLGSMWFARRGSLLGLLFWPGSLFIVFYNYLAYLFSLPFSAASPLFLALAASSAYTIIGLVASIDGQAIQQRLTGVVPENIIGGALVGIGVAICLLNASTLAHGLTGQAPIGAAESGTLVADSMIIPAWIIGGFLLWRRKALGYVGAAGLLFQTSMLFIGLIFLFLLQPLLTSAPLPLVDIIVVFIMGMICFIPFALFIRGALSSKDPSAV